MTFPLGVRAENPKLTADETRFLDVLRSADSGRDEALASALPNVYDELRRIAAAYLREERTGHTLQPTALVHEAYLRLLRQHQIDPANRLQVVGMAARMMRRILLDHANARRAEKRGGESAVRLSLDEALDFYEERDISVEAVDDALCELEGLDEQQARIVELRFFAGLTIEEISQALAISCAKVNREWATAKLWLKLRLADVA